MKHKTFYLKQLYYSNYDQRWHADDKYTYKVLGVSMLSDGAIGVELVRKGALPFIFRFTNRTNGLWRIGHKDYDIRSDAVLYEFYKDVQNGLTETTLEVLK